MRFPKLNIKGLIQAGREKLQAFGFTVLLGAFSGFNGQSRWNDQRLIDHGYVSNADIYSIIRKIIDSALTIPWKVVNDEDGEVTVSTDGEFYELMKQPEMGRSKMDWLEESIGFYLLTGNTLWKKRKLSLSSDIIVELQIMPTTLVEVEESSLTYGKCKNYVWQEGPTTTSKVDPDDVMHLKCFNPSRWGVQGCWGLSPLQAGLLMMKASNNRFVADASLLENRGATGLISNESEDGFDEEEKKDIQKVTDKKFGGARKFGQIVATSAKVKYQQIGLTPVEMQMIESAQLKLRQACNLYSTDSSLFNDPANKTFNNRDAAMKSLFTEAVIPLLEKFLDTINNEVAPSMNEQSGRNEKVVLDLKKVEVLQKNQFEEVKKNAKMSEAIQKLLAAITKGELTPGQAINILVESWGMPEDKASKIVNGQS